jgi:hypothetical protein
MLLFVGYRKACDLVWGEILPKIIFEFGKEKNKCKSLRCMEWLLKSTYLSVNISMM